VNDSQDFVIPTLILEDDIRGGGWKVVPAKLLHDSIAANDSGRALAEKYWEKSKERRFPGSILTVDGYMSAYIQFGNPIFAVRVDQNQAN